MSSESTEQDPDTLVRAQDKEIVQLREQIARASIRQSELLNEKYALQRKFSEMRVALDVKQSEVITSASNELALRKGDLEVNLNLLTELKATEHEKHIFTTSLLEILAQFGSLPHATNASFLTNSIKNFHDQLQLNIRTSQAKLAELNSMIGNSTNTASGFGPSNSQFPNSSKGVGEFSQYGHYVDNRSIQTRNDIQDGLPNQVQNFTNSIEVRHLANTGSPLRGVSGYYGDNMLERNGFLNGVDHRTISQFAQQTVSPEDYPGVDNFQIVGVAKPGCEISGCGYPRGGTSLCMFQWVRHNPDGTTEFIEGATYPTYVVTVDDVDKLIAVECIPMDELGRQGAIVRMFANDSNKITCDDEMQEKIDALVSNGSAMFSVLILLGSSEKWEPATFVLQQSGFLIKVENTQEPLISEKYSKELSIKIPSGLSAQFVLTCSNGISYPLSTKDDVRMRDTLVLTMRIFQSKVVGEKRK